MVLCMRSLSAPKSRDSLRLRRRFLPLPQESRDFCEAPRCAISSAKKIASEPRSLLRREWVKMVLTAEFPAIPSSAIKIASEQRCAILVHSVRSTPISRDTAILSLRYPISRDTFLREVSSPPKWCDTPPWHLVSHKHICAIPHFATYRAIMVRFAPQNLDGGNSALVIGF